MQVYREHSPVEDKASVISLRASPGSSNNFHVLHPISASCAGGSLNTGSPLAKGSNLDTQASQPLLLPVASTCLNTEGRDRPSEAIHAKFVERRGSNLDDHASTLAGMAYYSVLEDCSKRGGREQNNWKTLPLPMHRL